MKKILLHPTHRKFIRLLRKHILQGGMIIVTKADIESWEELLYRTQIALKRHKGTYKILLRAMRRTEVHEGNFIFGSSHVDFIENVFCKVERKRIFVTIRNIILRPILHKASHFLNKKSNGTSKSDTEFARVFAETRKGALKRKI